MYLPAIQASTGKPIGQSRPRLRVEQEALPGDSLTLSWPDSLHSSSPATGPTIESVDKPAPVAASGWLRQVGKLDDKASLAAFSRQEVSQILTVAAGLRRVSGSLSPETREILEKYPEVPALLAGVLPAITVPVSEAGFAEFTKIADAFSVSTGQSIEIGDDPATPGKAVLVHNGAVEKLAPHLLGSRYGQFRFQWDKWNAASQSDLGVVHLGEKPANSLGPIAILDPDAEAKAAMRQARVRDCQSLVEKGCGAREPGPTTPSKIGMISYVSSDYQFQRLESVLREWQGNLQGFGHHHVSLRLCDDSPAPYGDKIKTMLAELSQQGPNAFVYLGPEEKSEIRNRLKKDLKGALPPKDAEAVATLIAGPGPTQNRNLSLQLLGSEGGLQVDHDMTAEVLTKHFDHPLPYDLLGSLESAPQDHLSSLRFCGAEDQAIDLILQADLPAPERSGWLASENREPARPKTVDTLNDEGMGGGLRAPMHVPKNFSLAARISPGMRDGDLALGEVSTLISGKPSTELPQSIHHRDAAGSRWGGAPLLKEFLKFATVYYVYGGMNQSGTDPQELSKQLLEVARPESTTLTSVENTWFYGTARGAVNVFLSQRQGKIEQLKELLSASPFPNKLESWSGQSLTPKLKKQSKSEIRMIIEKLEAESREMREKLHVGPDGQIDSKALTDDLHQETRQLLRSHALALAHSDQIAASLAKAV